MTTKYFQKVNMASESIRSWTRTGVNSASCSSGAFVVPSTLASNTVYANFMSGSTVKDINTFTIAAPADATSKNIWVVDPVKVTDGTIAGNTYRMGAKTLSFDLSASEKVAIRKLDVLDQFQLGDGNFGSAPTEGQYAVLIAADTLLSPCANQAATGFCVRIDQKVSVSQGIDASTGYLCTVVQLP